MQLLNRRFLYVLIFLTRAICIALKKIQLLILICINMARARSSGGKSCSESCLRREIFGVKSQKDDSALV